MVLYHSTTDSLRVGNLLLPPVSTGVKREHWRTKYEDVVFLTDSMRAARMYAKKAAAKYGGNPVVLVCEPIGFLFCTKNAEYTTPKAKVTDRIRVTEKTM